MGFGYIVLATGHTAKKNNAYIIIQSCLYGRPNPNMAVFIYLFECWTLFWQTHNGRIWLEPWIKGKKKKAKSSPICRLTELLIEFLFFFFPFRIAFKWIVFQKIFFFLVFCFVSKLKEIMWGYKVLYKTFRPKVDQWAIECIATIWIQKGLFWTEIIENKTQCI